MAITFNIVLTCGDACFPSNLVPTEWAGSRSRRDRWTSVEETQNALQNATGE